MLLRNIVTKTFYNNLDYFVAENIEDEVVKQHVTEELKGMNIERLQLELNALIMCGPEMQPDRRWVSKCLQRKLIFIRFLMISTYRCFS